MSPNREADERVSTHVTLPFLMPDGAAVLAARGTLGRTKCADIHEFYGDVFPLLSSYCWTLVRDSGHAEDLAQEAFVRLVGRWVHVRDPKPFVFHVATNLARDSWRRGTVEKRYLERRAAELTEHVDPDYASLAALQDAVGRLPRRFQEVVLLFYYADLPVGEVAQAVNRPVGTVKRQLSEARQLLASALEDPDE